MPKRDRRARQVRVVAAAETEAARVVSASGTLAADDQFVLGTKVVGRLGEITVDLGSRVKKGQAIARIDQSDYRLRVEQADAALQQSRVRLGLPASGNSDKVDIEQTSTVRQAAAVLKEARLTHDRMVELWDRKLIARAELDTAVSQLAVAEGRYQDAIEEVRNRQADIGAAPFRARDRAPTACRYRHRFAHRRRRQRTPGGRRPIPAGRRARRDSGAH